MARHGTNEQSWPVHGYHSVYQGYSVSEIVTANRSPSGERRPREATGRGVVYLIERAMNILKIDPEKCTAIVQGFWETSARWRHFRSRIKSGVKSSASAINRGNLQPEGIDVKLRAARLQKRTLESVRSREPCRPKQLLTMKCMWLIPAAVDRVIPKKMLRNYSAAFWLKRQRTDDAGSGSHFPNNDMG